MSSSKIDNFSPRLETDQRYGPEHPLAWKLTSVTAPSTPNIVNFSPRLETDQRYGPEHPLAWKLTRVTVYSMTYL